MHLSCHSFMSHQLGANSFSLYIYYPPWLLEKRQHYTPLFQARPVPPSKPVPIPFNPVVWVMEGISTTDTATTTKTAAPFPLSSSSSSSPTSSSPPPGLPQPPSPAVVLSPCAACKILRRRCAQKCVLAPYFPPNDPIKFTTAHRVFGASNIIKLLQDLPEAQRADAVSSMVYEANARIRDPVYGCAGAICQLQKQVNELEAQLARAQADLINGQTQHENLLAILCMAHSQQLISSPAPSNLDGSTLAGAGGPSTSFSLNEACFLEDNGQLPMWEPLWA